jgi:hypothetical protein
VIESDPVLEKLFAPHSISQIRRGTEKSEKLPHMENISLVRVKAQHHRIAQLCATGASNVEVGAACGYTPQYISNLRTANPAFQELVEHYTRAAEAEMLSLRAKQSRLGEMAVDELTDRLAEDPDAFTVRELMEVVDSNVNRPRLVEAQKGFGQAGPPSPVTIQFVTAEHPVSGPIIEGEKS